MVPIRSGGLTVLTFMILTSLFALAAMNYGIWKPPSNRSGFTLVELIVVVTMISMFCSLIYTPVLLVQLAVSILGLITLAIPRHGHRISSMLTVLGCVFAWGMLVDKVSAHRRHVDSLREANLFVSMEDRLPTPKPTTDVPESQMDVIEARSEFKSSPSSRHFEQLHSENIKDFAMTSGFGVGRMTSTNHTLRSIRRSTQLPEPIPQPGTLRDEIGVPGDAMPDARLRDFFGFHADSVGSFVNVKGFGYLKSRREVAGFTPHAFESEPKPQVPYTLERLELVGLIRNPEPAVYVSEFLPRMTELDAVTTRPADGFEAAGLKRLAAGEDLVANAVGPKVRLLGAIRNMTACVECHGGRRGDLLGAFSYRLTETPTRAE